MLQEDFQVWANGSVCPQLFYKTQGKHSVIASDEIGGARDLTENRRVAMERVLKHYGVHDAQWLSQLTHMEEPWIIARMGSPAGMGCNNIITKESMAIYYGGL